MGDQHQFMLHHRVMRQEQDADITVDIVKDTQINFPQLQGCSFDKGFYKDKLNQLEKLQESDPEFC